MKIFATDLYQCAGNHAESELSGTNQRWQNCIEQYIDHFAFKNKKPGKKL
jgi:hypothetical protein